MKKRVESLKISFYEELKKSDSQEDLEAIRLKYLGRKGKFKEITNLMSRETAKDKRSFGIVVNKLKGEIKEALKHKGESLGHASSQSFDVTLPEIYPKIGSLHIVTRTIEEVQKIFSHLGFYRKRYPEVDTDYFAFEALNMPQGHPARDEWETFFIKGSGTKVVLTPHTSNSQVREMQNTRGPIRLLNIAKCYRRQEDATHTQMFHQFEGLLIDKNISIRNLLGTLDFFAKNYFGGNRKIRLRPFDFRFTKPSFEIDINCPHCLGKGCRVCKGGWHELGGAGMVHPNVLKEGGVNTKKYDGFAFGWGIERIAMMKYAITDLRMFYQNDLRFLKQF